MKKLQFKSGHILSVGTDGERIVLWVGRPGEDLIPWRMSPDWAMSLATDLWRAAKFVAPGEVEEGIS